ncbi:MAG: GDP-mannose 4,6-dehydratase [Candidatus Methylacidiphilales bacterium]|nr:GDP-mannose 4,6-dehydratase [Candidatus Methylacidiphilales bacterium]
MLKRALIAGISGQDGSYLARLLLEKGYEVHGISRNHRTQAFANARRLGILSRLHLHTLTLDDTSRCAGFLKEVRPDEVYHLSGQTSVGHSFSDPVEAHQSIAVATLHLLEALRRAGGACRFYNAGSSEVFGNTEVPAREDTPFHPRSPYAIAKVAAHHAVAHYREAYGLFCCTGILFNHESPLRPLHFVTRKIVSAAAAIREGRMEHVELGRTSMRRDWGWAPEYVEAMWLMLQQDEPRDFIIATGQHHSLQCFVEKVFACHQLDWAKHVVFNQALVRPTDIDINFGDATLAREKLGWSPTVMLDDLIQRLHLDRHDGTTVLG